MLEYLENFKSEDYDSFTFLPAEEDNQLHFQCFSYKDPGIKLDGSELGDCYHIILFKEGEESLIHLDKFEAILLDPLEYISQLIPSGWFGIVCRKTTTSGPFVQKTFDNFKDI
jgi:hypothetical protein